MGQLSDKENAPRDEEQQDFHGGQIAEQWRMNPCAER
jgi:hypothetical protein